MAKLNWSRAKQWVFDHARYLPLTRDDFVTPDDTRSVKGKKAKSPLPAALRDAVDREKRAAKQQQQRRAKELEQRAKAKAAKRAAKLERQRLTQEKQAKAKAQKAQQEKAKSIKQAERRVADDARRAAIKEYRKSPEYAAEMERKAAEMAAKKKTHREAWAEKQPGLRTDRDNLQQTWRERLLGKRQRDGDADR